MIRQPVLLRVAAFLLLAMLFSSCGFALRGSNTVSTNFSQLALNLQQPNGEFARLLRRSLEEAGVEAQLSDSSPLLAILSVEAEQLVSRPVTVNPQARAAQYEISLSVDISLAQAQQVLITNETLTVERIYIEDIANLAGTRDEVELITSEMRRDLVDQLLRRLDASSIRS